MNLKTCILACRRDANRFSDAVNSWYVYNITWSLRLITADHSPRHFIYWTLISTTNFDQKNRISAPLNTIAIYKTSIVYFFTFRLFVIARTVDLGVLGAMWFALWSQLDSNSFCELMMGFLFPFRFLLLRSSGDRDRTDFKSFPHSLVVSNQLPNNQAFLCLWHTLKDLINWIKDSLKFA